jgi:hypothetical protein
MTPQAKDLHGFFMPSNKETYTMITRTTLALSALSIFACLAPKVAADNLPEHDLVLRIACEPDGNDG